jgi:hypothetical protein
VSDPERSIVLPAELVAQSSRPVGELQLHRLTERVDFQCVRCSQKKTADRVAVRAADWGQTICQHCYGSQVQAHHANATAHPSKETHAHAQSGTHNFQPVADGHAAPTNPEQLHDPQLQDVKRQLPGINFVISFFSEAGVRAELLPSGRLAVDGKLTAPLTERTWSSDPARLNDLIDEITANYIEGLLLASVVRNTSHDIAARTSVKHHGNGFAIVQGGVRLVLIRATSAQVVKGDVIKGNFLKPGPHWRQMDKAIMAVQPRLLAGVKQAKRSATTSTSNTKANANSTRKARGRAARSVAQAEFAARAVKAAERAAARAAERAAAPAAIWAAEAARAKAAVAATTAAVVPGTGTESTSTSWVREEANVAASEGTELAATSAVRRVPVQQRIDNFPDGLAPELTRACLEASRRIRLERQVAYDRPVVLECNLGELILLPVRGTGPRLLLPFHLKKAAGTLNGELVLGNHDPLPLLIGSHVTDAEAIAAWTCALLGFADATCFEIEVVEPTPRSQVPTPRLPRGSLHSRHSIPDLPRIRQWPSQLLPVGSWSRHSGSFVAGHRRRLHNGQTASIEARYRARQVGIVLRPGETWVRPFTRGVPEGVEMRFRWNAPTELGSQTSAVTLRRHAEGVPRGRI